MKTITIDILNDKAIKLLQDLELLQLIRMRKEKKVIEGEHQVNWIKFKGAMKKQTVLDVDNQLDDLRNEWG